MPTDNPPIARLDVSTWSYHHEPPSTVDAVLDRKTDRLFTTGRVLNWVTAGFLVFAVLPALLGFIELLPPVVLAVGSVVLLGASLIVGMWHQQLRAHTGVPVIPILDDVLEPFASSMRGWQEAFTLALEENPDDYATEDLANLRDFQDSARKALAAHRKMTRVLTRQFIIHGELAAQADRRGWRRLRDRHVRTIANLVLQATANSPTNTDPTVPDHDRT